MYTCLWYSRIRTGDSYGLLMIMEMVCHFIAIWTPWGNYGNVYICSRFQHSSYRVTASDWKYVSCLCTLTRRVWRQIAMESQILFPFDQSQPLWAEWRSAVRMSQYLGFGWRNIGRHQDRLKNTGDIQGHCTWSHTCIVFASQNMRWYFHTYKCNFNAVACSKFIQFSRCKISALRLAQ